MALLTQSATAVTSVIRAAVVVKQESTLTQISILVIARNYVGPVLQANLPSKMDKHQLANLLIMHG